MEADLKFDCWEIMNCENIDCQARQEPETACWEIARRNESFHNISNTCSDCIVYVFKNELPILSTKKALNIIEQRSINKKLEVGHGVCA